jgi:phenylalanyl-tRNA synthetase beta chain
MDSSRNLISKVELYDEYKGKNMSPEKRSLTFSLMFSSANKTLNDDLIAGEMKKIIQSLENKFKIEMR